MSKPKIVIVLHNLIVGGAEIVMLNLAREFSKQYKNIILLGRLAEYEYYDMDDIVARALEVFDREIRDAR